MVNWIFDLDNTLYQGTLNNYNNLKEDSNLRKLIYHLPGKKILFTNGTFYHAKICLERMKLNNFLKIL